MRGELSRFDQEIDGAGVGLQPVGFVARDAVETAVAPGAATGSDGSRDWD